jgi:hypothetical protein
MIAPSNKMNVSPDIWLKIARFLGEDALGLAFAIRDRDPNLAEAVYHIAEEHHLAAQEEFEESVRGLKTELEERVRRINELPP